VSESLEHIALNQLRTLAGRMSQLDKQYVAFLRSDLGEEPVELRKALEKQLRQTALHDIMEEAIQKSFQSLLKQYMKRSRYWDALRKRASGTSPVAGATKASAARIRARPPVKLKPPPEPKKFDTAPRGIPAAQLLEELLNRRARMPHSETLEANIDAVRRNLSN